MNQSGGSSVQTEIFPPENIRFHTKYTKRYFTEIMIFCFVVGTNLGSVFKVKSKTTLSVADLKDVIYEKKKNNFKDKGFDPSDLHLWKVDIPYDTENVKLRTLQNRSRDMDEENIIKELGGKELSPVDDIGDIFKCDSKNIRIIVRPPATTVSSMYIPSNELKTEIKNKVIKAFPHINILSIDQLIDALALIWNVNIIESDSLGPQNDPYFNLKTEPSFFKTNLPRSVTKQTSTTVDLCLPSYNKSGANYRNPFYDDPQFKDTVSLVLEKIENESKDIVVLAGVSGGGKTSTTFGIAVERWSIYIDLSPIIGYYGVHLITELEEVKSLKPNFDDEKRQIDIYRMLDIAIISRGLLLIKMLIEGTVSTPKEWLLAQLQMNDSETRSTLRLRKYDHDTIIILISRINACLKLKNLTLILDEAQTLCSTTEYGKYKGSKDPDRTWNLLQAYVAHLLQYPTTCLLAGTYMHMASGISLVTSVGKDSNLQTHIVLKLPFLSHDDVLRNLDAVIDLEHVKTETRDLLGNLLKGRPRNCASFVRLLISTQRSNGKTKDQVLRELIPLWKHEICFSMAGYLVNACEHFGVNNLNPETAIMDILRHRVFYNHRFKEAVKLLQHSIIPCESPECIVLSYNARNVYDVIEINSSFESYLIDSIKLFLDKRNRKMIDVFVDNIIVLNNVTSIGNEFDAVFIAAIIEKHNCYVRKELDKWKGGQQFDLPSWITPKMKFITTSNISDAVHITEYVKNVTTYRTCAIQPELRSGSDVVLSIMDEDDVQNVVLLSASCTVSSSGSISKKKVTDQLIKSCLRFQYIECPTNTQKENPKRLCTGLNDILPNDDTANEEDNLEGEKDEDLYGQDLDYANLDYDLNYTENIKKYKLSDTSNHNQINTFIGSQKHICVSVEIPHRAESKRPALFRLNEYGDLVIVVDDRNMKHVFGEAAERLVENLRERGTLSKKRKNQEYLMDQTE